MNTSRERNTRTLPLFFLLTMGMISLTMDPSVVQAGTPDRITCGEYQFDFYDNGSGKVTRLDPRAQAGTLWTASSGEINIKWQEEGFRVGYILELHIDRSTGGGDLIRRTPSDYVFGGGRRERVQCKSNPAGPRKF